MLLAGEELCIVRESERDWEATHPHLPITTTGKTWQTAARAWNRKHQTAQAERTHRLTTHTFTADDILDHRLEDFTHPAAKQRLIQIADRYPVRWLFAPTDEEEQRLGKRAVNLFAGCGGLCTGLRRVLGVKLDMLCIDFSKDATATANAAGCNAICADVTQLDPSHPALRWTTILICTPPCTPWTRAGLQLGKNAENLRIITDVIGEAAEAAGNVWATGGFLNGEFIKPEYADPNGVTWPEVRAGLDGLSDKRAGLMAEIAIWGLGLTAAGAPLETILVEQSSALPDQLRAAIGVEFEIAGLSATWMDVKASQVGSPSERVRAFLMVSEKPVDTSEITGMEPITTLAAQALAHRPAGTTVITRGNRTTSGGNGFHLERTVPAITSKIRNWWVFNPDGTRAEDFSLAEVATLLAMPEDFPVQGSRTSACQQLGDIVSPIVAALVSGAVLGVPAARAIRAYLAERFPHIHGKPKKTKTKKPKKSKGKKSGKPPGHAHRGDYCQVNITINPASRAVSRFLSCPYGGRSRLGSFDQSSTQHPVQNLSTSGAEAVAERHNYRLTGPWTTHTPHVRTAPVAWEPPRSAPAASPTPPSPRKLTAEEEVERETAAIMARREAARAVPGLYWTVAMAAAVQQAADGHLYTPDGGATFRYTPVPGRTGRKVLADRIRRLTEAGYLALDLEAGKVNATADGRKALALAGLHPDGLYETDRAAYDAHYAALGRRKGIRNDDRKAKAAAVPPLPGGEQARRLAAAARAQLEVWEEQAKVRRAEARAIVERAVAKERAKQERKEAAKEEERREREARALAGAVRGPMQLLTYAARNALFRGPDDEHGRPGFYIHNPGRGIGHAPAHPDDVRQLQNEKLLTAGEEHQALYLTVEIAVTAELCTSLLPGGMLLSLYNGAGNETNRILVPGVYEGIDQVDRQLLADLIKERGYLVTGPWTGHGTSTTSRKAGLEPLRSSLATRTPIAA
ncbi:DNA cytosine methyltransferase [Streptomyces sp. CS014]|uniref:DNA cytosine methyltransferase n=1 Tax=Streptomyces sp. CS014 TaxID=2162707 RepID=UPI0013A59E38|nr:DNA cytosine methyltransferase [Streptomyces sp. CS014]